MTTTAEEVWSLLRELAKSQQETDRSIQETDRRMKDTDRQIKELGKQIGGLGEKFGSFTEGLALPSMENILRTRDAGPTAARDGQRRQHLFPG